MTFRSLRRAQQLLEVAEQEVDVEAALVRLVDDHRVVARQPAVGLDLRQQDAVGHELDRGLLADVVVEAHLVADRAAERHLQLLRDAPRDRARRDPPRLRAADHAGRAAPGGQAQLRQLRGLARAGLAGDHDHLVRADQLDDAFGLRRDRQVGIDLGPRQCRGARLARGDRCLQRLFEIRLRLCIAGFRAPARPQALQAPTIARQRAFDRAPACASAGSAARACGRFHSLHRSLR